MDGGMNPAFQAKYRTSLVKLADGKVHTMVEERATGSVSASAEAPQSGSQSTGNFFTRLFGGGSSEEEKPQPAVAQTTAPAAKSAPVRTASASKPAAKSEPKQEAHAKPHGPKPQAPAQSPAQQTAQAAPQPARSAEATKLPESTTAFSGGVMSGAQPVVPAGSFESRWSALR
jgi:hypothetical protein